MLANYIDDLNGALIGTHNAEGIPLRCRLDEPRAYAGPDGYPPPDGYDSEIRDPLPTDLHMALAVIKRWAFLCLDMCGLKV